ncbi:MAG: ornithine carbamoyltransferase, partial [Acidimicrobiales bacterium]
MTGMDVRIVAPRDLWNSAEVVAEAEAIAAATGARLTHTDVVADGVAGVDFVYTDVWVSRSPRSATDVLTAPSSP